MLCHARGSPHANLNAVTPLREDEELRECVVKSGVSCFPAV